MNKLLLFSLFLFFFCKEQENKVDLNIAKYNAIIYNAENSIIEEDYKSALLSYRKAEKNIENMFALDLYNALLSSVYIKDWESSLYWAKRLVGKGVDSAFFKREIFNEFKESEYWKKFEKNYHLYKSVFSNSVNKKLLDSLTILTTIDQQEYCQLPTGKVELSDAFLKTKFIDSLLSKLIRNNGYPSEEKVGAPIIKDTILSPLPKFYALLRHSYQANSTLIKDHLYEATEKGLLKEEILSKILNIDDMQFVVIDCKIYENKLLKKNISTDLMRKKIIFNNTNNRGFVLYAPLAILEGITKEEMGNDFNVVYSYLRDYLNCPN